MSYKLLIDECLHPGLAAIAKRRGIQADFVPYLGLATWQDHNLVPLAIERDYIMVTNNRRDFLKLYLQHGVNGGFVIIVPRIERDRIDKLFEMALDRLIEMNEDLVNKVVEVLEDGSVHVREWNQKIMTSAILTIPHGAETQGLRFQSGING